MPDCPRCAADARHVHIVAVIVHDKTGVVKTELACNCCGWGWVIIDPD